jgi:hypothetical protein
MNSFTIIFTYNFLHPIKYLIYLKWGLNKVEKWQKRGNIKHKCYPFDFPFPSTACFPYNFPRQNNAFYISEWTFWKVVGFREQGMKMAPRRMIKVLSFCRA